MGDAGLFTLAPARVLHGAGGLRAVGVRAGHGAWQLARGYSAAPSSCTASRVLMSWRSPGAGHGARQPAAVGASAYGRSGSGARAAGLTWPAAACRGHRARSPGPLASLCGLGCGGGTSHRVPWRSIWLRRLAVGRSAAVCVGRPENVAAVRRKAPAWQARTRQLRVAVPTPWRSVGSGGSAATLARVQVAHSAWQ